MILASQSPRRRQLLEEAGFTFECIPSDFDESEISNLEPPQLVEALATGKASAVSQKYPSEIVIGADTIVVYNQDVLGKPKDAPDASRMLHMLSGHTHTVYTGVCIMRNSEVLSSFTSHTDVTFWPLTDKEIDDYVKSGDPLDKAGSYGIQSRFGRLLIQRINGDYYTVIGLPLGELVRKLNAIL